MNEARDAVLGALGEVFDPELDEPVTKLGFVSSCELSPDGDVEIALRLPTPQCAPNFAFLMAADARAAVAGLPDVRGVRVTLIDHYTGEEINSALAAGADFEGAFPGESDPGSGSLRSLRELFQRKALVARQSRIAQALLAAGTDEEKLCAMRVADLEDSATALGLASEARRCLALRSALGIGNGPGDAAFVLPNGWTLEPDGLRRWLAMARTVRTSLEVNGGICRSLLSARYGVVENEPVEEVLS